MTEKGSFSPPKEIAANGVANKHLVNRTEVNQVVVGFDSCVSTKRKIPAEGVKYSARRPLESLLKK